MPTSQFCAIPAGFKETPFRLIRVVQDRMSGGVLTPVLWAAIRYV